MNPSPDPADPGRLHEQTLELIPWLVNGRLPDSDVARIESHLAECAECRAEVESERRIMRLVRENTRVDYAPQASLQKLWARIEEMEHDVPSRAPSQPSDAGHLRSRAAAPRWTLAASIVCALALGLLAAAWWRPLAPAQNAPYRTATSEKRATANEVRIRVVFAPAVTMDELAQIVSAHRLTIVDGPSDAGVFGLATSPGSEGTVVEALERLRADPRIRFAEPVRTGPDPP